MRVRWRVRMSVDTPCRLQHTAKQFSINECLIAKPKTGSRILHVSIDHDCGTGYAARAGQSLTDACLNAKLPGAVWKHEALTR